MSTLNKYQKSVRSAVAAYAKGSARLVRLFEEAALRYWNEDSRTVDNLQFFLNELKPFPVLQKAAVESTRTFGKFTIELKDGSVSIANKGKVTAEQRAKYEKAVDDYKAQEYNSLLAAHQTKLLQAFDLTKRLTGFENSATALIVDALANNASQSKEALITQLKQVIDAIATKDLEDKITERRAEVEANKIDPAAVLDAANAEQPQQQPA